MSETPTEQVKLCPFRFEQQNPGAFKNNLGQSCDWKDITNLPCLEDKCQMWKKDEHRQDSLTYVLTCYCGLAGKP
jgi:hypothetical protein